MHGYSTSAQRHTARAGGVILSSILAAAALGEQILVIDSDVLTAYPFTTATTPVQGVAPRLEQRGATIDGALNSPSVLGWSLQGNPYASGVGRSRVFDSIDLASGTCAPTDVDLALPAPGFRWVIGRSYNARQSFDGSSLSSSNGPQGRNWFQLSQPELLFLEEDEGEEDDIVHIVYGADRYLQFTRVMDESTPTDTFRGVNGTAGAVIYTAGSPDLFVYYDQKGTKTTFFGGNTASNKADWQIWKIEDAAGNFAFVGDASTASTAVTNGYDAGGRITSAYDTIDRRYTYTYTTIDSTARLTQVVAETRSGGSWASPGTVTEVGKVDYTYYSVAGGQTYGNTGNLQKVTVTTPLSDSGISQVRTKLYRYWVGTFNAVTNPGHPHTIQYVVDFEGYRRADWAGDSSFDDDPLTMSESVLKPYAAAYFEYDSDYRIVSTWMNGQCGCGGASNGEYALTYANNGSFSGSGGYDTTWHRRVIIARPDGSYMTQYFDETGQALSKLVSEADPSTVSTSSNTVMYWATRVARDSSGIVTEIASPANSSSYNHSTGAFNQATSGLLTPYALETSGDLTGFTLENRHKDGTSGTSYLQSATGHTSSALATGDFDVVRPFTNASRAYYGLETSGTSNSDLTSTSLSYYSSGAILMPKVITSTLPVVTTGQNGSNSANVTRRYLRADGTTAFTEGPDGVFTYTEYENGQVVLRIQDAQTNHGSDFASGDDPSSDFGISETGAGLRLITSYTYDAQGRPNEATMPSGRTTKSYYSRLADHRMVTISIPRVTGGPTYYGPATFTVTNQAGKVEASGTIALSGGSSGSALSGWIDESEAEIVDAVLVGTIARLQERIYDEAGTQLEESRVYYDLSTPAYDATTYGHDEMGRQWRRVSPAGTIQRSVFDDAGRVIESWTGTNDNGWTGGSPSGSANMVKTSTVLFDDNTTDNIGGNSLVAERTAHPSSSSGDDRVTAYVHDYRGRTVITDNPTAPHSLSKFDNLGRVVASGQYSSVGGLTVSSDPTSEDTARLALSQSFYDSMGRVYESQRFEIDASDGSDGANLATLNWYDAAGRMIKTNGAQFTKTFYDRVGRVTHRFVLAELNDSAYSDADDVSGDIVLEESQSVYDSATGRVLMSAAISRFHSDKGGGETAGALDTNADTDALKYTASDIKGRIQISSTWYDDLDRPITTGRYGTNAGSLFNRSGLSAPGSSSSSVLVSEITYNDDGSQLETTDPRGLVTRTLYDDAGRRIATIANYVDGTPSGSAGATDDSYTRYEYTDGHMTKMWVDFDGDGVVDTSAPKDQQTIYTYGTTVGSFPASYIASNDLLLSIAYPDSAGGGDVVTMAYSRLGQEVYREDQDGNVLQTEFDDSGRRTNLRATTINTDTDPDGIDDAVKQIEWAYDSLGRISTVSQYASTSVPGGTPLDQVKYTYDGFSSITSFEQDPNSAVGTGTDDFEVLYDFDTVGSASTGVGWESVRITQQKLRHGATDRAEVNYEYLSTSDRFDDAVNRISRVKLSTTAVADYDYLGMGRVVGTTYPEINVFSKQYSSTPGAYPDLDQFNRMVVNDWTKDLATDRDLYQVDITYDYGSNIARIEDDIYPGRDVAYSIDNMNRLTAAEEGTWSGSMGSQTRKQEWTLDRVGNWAAQKNDLNFDASYSGPNETNQTFEYNPGNEYSKMTNVTIATDYALTARDPYNPRGDSLWDPIQNYVYKYDAFGRLVKIFYQLTPSDPEVLLAEYRYNGLGHRIGWHYDVDVDGTVEATSDDPWLYFAYDPQWRMVGLFRGADTNARELFVNHPVGYGVDGVIMRDRDANTALSSAMDGTREERLYHLQNWRGDVVRLISAASGGRQAEGARFSSYGVPWGIALRDIDGDGDVDTDDSDFMLAWSGVSYDARGDFDLDGDVDSSDETIFNGNSDPALGWGSLSNFASRKGYAGYEHDGNFDVLAHVRNRVYATDLGRWTRRDPAGFVDGVNAYSYLGDGPITGSDSAAREFGTSQAFASRKVRQPFAEFEEAIDEDDEPPGGFNCTLGFCPDCNQDLDWNGDQSQPTCDEFHPNSTQNIRITRGPNSAGVIEIKTYPGCYRCEHPADPNGRCLVEWEYHSNGNFEVCELRCTLYGTPGGSHCPIYDAPLP